MTAKSKRTKRQAAENDERPDTKGRRIESRDVDSLHPHPRQTEFFSDLSEHELAVLAEDIQRHGMDKPPEILPNGTVIRGHQRVRAARSLGWEKIDVIVRDDLEDADEDTILEAFLGDNLHRRHLSKLQQARCATKIAEIECERRNLIFDWERDPRILKDVAKRLQCSGKTARRYISVSKTPLPVQQAFELDLLTLVSAAGVSNLRQEVQEKLAASIAKLLAQAEAKGPQAIKKTIRAVVCTALDKSKWRKRVRPPSPASPLYAIKSSLDQNLGAAQENLDQIIVHVHGNPGFGDSPFFDAARDLRRQIVIDLRERCERLRELLIQIETGMEPDSATAACTASDRNDAAVAADVDPLDIMST